MPPHHLLFPSLITTLIILGEKYKLWSSSSCSFLQPPVTLSFLHPNTLSVYILLSQWETKFHTHREQQVKVLFYVFYSLHFQIGKWSWMIQNWNVRSSFFNLIGFMECKLQNLSERNSFCSMMNKVTKCNWPHYVFCGVVIISFSLLKPPAVLPLSFSMMLIHHMLAVNLYNAQHFIMHCCASIVPDTSDVWMMAYLSAASMLSLWALWRLSLRDVRFCIWGILTRPTLLMFPMLYCCTWPMCGDDST